MPQSVVAFATRRPPPATNSSQQSMIPVSHRSARECALRLCIASTLQPALLHFALLHFPACTEVSNSLRHTATVQEIGNYHPCAGLSCPLRYSGGWHRASHKVGCTGRAPELSLGGLRLPGVVTHLVPVPKGTERRSAEYRKCLIEVYLQTKLLSKYQILPTCQGVHIPAWC